MWIYRVVRVISGLLWVFLIVVYLAAKLDFIQQYFRLDTALYLKEHSRYWIAMAAVMFLIWLTERFIYSHKQS